MLPFLVTCSALRSLFMPTRSEGPSAAPHNLLALLQNSLNSSGMNTQHPTRDADPERRSVPSPAEGPSGAEGFVSCCGYHRITANSLAINTYKNRASNPFRMNTCKKTGGGGALVPSARNLSTTLFFTLSLSLQRAKCIPNRSNHFRTLWANCRGVPKWFPLWNAPPYLPLSCLSPKLRTVD